MYGERAYIRNLEMVVLKRKGYLAVDSERKMAAYECRWNVVGCCRGKDAGVHCGIGTLFLAIAYGGGCRFCHECCI